jgi:CRP/FNR family cyclic AMP-dependent transcriptional regulator
LVDIDLPEVNAFCPIGLPCFPLLLIIEGRGTVNGNPVDALGESFLQDLPDEVRRELAASVRVVEFRQGSYIYDPQVSIVAAGTLRAFMADESGRHLTACYFRRPDAIGIGDAAGRVFPLAFQAHTDCTLLRFSQAQFDEIVRANPEIGWAAAKVLSGILDQVLGELARVAFLTVRDRVAHHLLALTESGELTAIHQAELASAVGSVREVVSRTATTLRDEGLVSVDQSGVRPVDEVGLRRLVGQWEN